MDYMPGCRELTNFNSGAVGENVSLDSLPGSQKSCRAYFGCFFLLVEVSVIVAPYGESTDSLPSLVHFG